MRVKSLMSAVGAVVVLGGTAAGWWGMSATSMGSSQPMSSSSSMPSGRHTMPDGTVMDGPSMTSATSASAGPASGQDGQPSSAASMVCGDETAQAVQRTFAMKALPRRTSVWSDPVYRCTYALAAGELTVTVADLSTAEAGRTWFDSLRRRLPTPVTIAGMANFDFPAFETRRGDVVFFKDDKTLWVDASSVATSQLPAHSTRTDAAYQIASAVIACWSD